MTPSLYPVIVVYCFLNAYGIVLSHNVINAEKFGIVIASQIPWIVLSSSSRASRSARDDRRVPSAGDEARGRPRACSVCSAEKRSIETEQSGTPLSPHRPPMNNLDTALLLHPFTTARARS